MSDSRGGAIKLAERVMAVLNDGSFSTTYKYATLIALMDVCMERATTKGLVPQTVTTRQLAERVLAMYWPHASGYPRSGGPVVLRAAGTGQAEIITLVRKFREGLAEPDASLFAARQQRPGPYETLLRNVEWKLVQMPLPRLQTIGGQAHKFLYHINWGADITRGAFNGKDFDNQVYLRPGVGDDLVRLHALLRPLIQREWTRTVARYNDLQEARLERFLFGASRTVTTPVRNGLREIQDNECFYCGKKIGKGKDSGPHVDHFMPWSRYQDDGIENLVLAHERCNHGKRDYLAATDHLGHWLERFNCNLDVGRQLYQLAQDKQWESRPESTLGVASSVYHRLPGYSQLWVKKITFEPVDARAIRKAFASIP